MIKDDPRLILNLNIKDEELEKKIQLSVNDYIEKNIDKVLSDKIEAAIIRSVEKYFNDGADIYSSYTRRKFFHDLDKKIDELIDKRLDERIAVKIMDRISKLLNNQLYTESVNDFSYTAVPLDNKEEN